MDDREKNEELRPTKMRGVVFPKAKYGVIAAIIIIVVVNLIYRRFGGRSADLPWIRWFS